MTERLNVDFNPAEGAVVRMVGLVERRGYVVRSLTMAEQSGAASLSIDVEPRDSARRMHVLAQQLGRLVDVTRVTFATVEPGLPS